MRGIAIDSLEKFEAQLVERLQPVKPDPIFVERVGDRLRSVPQVILEQRRSLLPIVWILVALLMGVSVFWLLGRIKRSHPPA